MSTHACSPRIGRWLLKIRSLTQAAAVCAVLGASVALGANVSDEATFDAAITAGFNDPTPDLLMSFTADIIAPGLTMNAPDITPVDGANLIVQSSVGGDDPPSQRQ